MNTAFWFSFVFTCGIAVGKGLPRLLEWLLNRYEKKIVKELKESEADDADQARE